jgi:hypothetical protein
MDLDSHLESTAREIAQLESSNGALRLALKELHEHKPYLHSKTLRQENASLKGQIDNYGELGRQVQALARGLAERTASMLQAGDRLALAAQKHDRPAI